MIFWLKNQSTHELYGRLMALKYAIRSCAQCALLSLFTILMLGSCTIEPELHLPVENIKRLHIELVTDTSLRTPYTHYPVPSSYEFRHFVVGNDSVEQNVESTTLVSPHLDRDVTDGLNRFLAWSNIDSNDGTQVVTIQEKDGRATASTTPDPDGVSMRDSTVGDSMGMPTIRHAPEMFYGGETTIDDVDSITNIEVRLFPRVYCLRVEVVLAGNDGHIVGTPGPTVLTSMARSVDIATGRTLHEPCGVYFTSKMTSHFTTRADSVTKNDTIRGELTTFGLCDMEPYAAANKNIFMGGRTDLRNYLLFTLTFNNGLSKIFRTDITDIVRNNNTEGLIRVVIDAKSIKKPDKPEPGQSGGAEGFHPVVDDYDDVVHEFTM